jgi:rod shape-determining protein MreD
MLERILLVVASRWFRLVLVVILVLSLQTTLFSEIRPWGYSVQLMAIFVATAGAVHDVRTAAIVGLVTGLMYDAVLATPLGVSGLVFGAIGAATALALQPFRDPTWWLRILIIGIASALSELLMPFTKALVGLGGWLEVRALAAMAVTFFAALVFAAPFVPVTRWTLREKVLLGR